MKSLRVALLALSALVVAGCAPSVVGGTWRTVTVQSNGWQADAITLEFIDGASVRIGLVQGGIMSCRRTYNASVVRPWQLNSEGKVVISTVGTCLLNVPSCDASGAEVPDGANACVFFQQAIGASLAQISDNVLVADDTNLRFQRSR